MQNQALFLNNFQRSIQQPILTDLFLRNRSTGLIVIGAATVHSLLVILGLPSWECPFRHQLGIPCPGCGLSRAFSALWHGDWQSAFAYHALAPFFVLALLIIGIFAIFPESKQRTEWMGTIAKIENKTGITALFLILLVVYWLQRLLFGGEAYFNLIMG